jgi:potassium-transporting ATPase KdpC subunit
MKTLARALGLLIVLTVLMGIVYPLVVTGIAQVAFPDAANGSLIERDGQVVGSSLIGQPFDDPKYFWSRPSATAPQPYNAASSGASNQGPTNPALIEAVKARVQALKASDPANVARIPVDLVTASASGLDPDISPAAAHWQVGRVARARGMDPSRVQALVDTVAQGRQFGVLGEPRVNVLALNLALDAGAR